MTLSELISVLDPAENIVIYRDADTFKDSILWRGLVKDIPEGLVTDELKVSRLLAIQYTIFVVVENYQRGEDDGENR